MRSVKLTPVIPEGSSLWRPLDYAAYRGEISMKNKQDPNVVVVTVVVLRYVEAKHTLLQL